MKGGHLHSPPRTRPEYALLSHKILDKYDPKTHAFLFIGRSPTALRDYMIMVGKMKFQSYQIPVSGLSDVDLASDTVVDRSTALFKAWLPPIADLKGKKLVLIDYTNTQANSLLRFKQLLQDYGRREGLELPELATLAMRWHSTLAMRWHSTLAPEERGALAGVDTVLDFDKGTDYGMMLNYSRFREIAPVPFYDLMRSTKLPLRETKLSYERMKYLNEIKIVINAYGETLAKTRRAFGLPPSTKPEWEASPCVMMLAGVGLVSFGASQALIEQLERGSPTKRR